MLLPTEQAEAAPVLRTGSQSGDVWDLQFRLDLLGFYNQKLDGVFGQQTATAVRRFQYQYGLPVDGIVGARTWSMLKKVSVNQRELDILAHVVYGEARGEPYTGQVAVAAVVMNRVQSSQFPNTVAGVVFQPRAFTAVDDGQYWLTPNGTAYRAAMEAVRGWDPTGGALYYFNPRTATSDWIWSRTQTMRVGKHIFAV
ncbi:spore cortex-lytic enzyme [Brevibacillus humidisoli]|uniref:spore cortex-lytic enzyme n=1 Tax=Brevibacillus humidisoli TaxID=2895522 RepID=UPI001E3AE5ED|nr:spore cortex-lytic enzyme [Brevibacillus humidisoli]UFJ43351.1 spore cortex-lytic enzyme [Brevibacillus humidisoli]